ncbi:unnamed protein product [Pleuronectes platessa]|uniref:Uncharacterized protein n=1 Tax=Pleuronectes platessa TaxID=8262 RepID=A0A9N7TY07_PLEPL|nr:unnamed protein product [Pleuronectes platessa]
MQLTLECRQQQQQQREEKEEEEGGGGNDGQYHSETWRGLDDDVDVGGGGSRDDDDDGDDDSSSDDGGNDGTRMRENNFDAMKTTWQMATITTKGGQVLSCGCGEDDKGGLKVFFKMALKPERRRRIPPPHSLPPILSSPTSARRGPSLIRLRGRVTLTEKSAAAIWVVNTLPQGHLQPQLPPSSPPPRLWWWLCFTPGSDKPPLPTVTAPFRCLITGEAEKSASPLMSRWMRGRRLSVGEKALTQIKRSPASVGRSSVQNWFQSCSRNDKLSVIKRHERAT